MPESVWWRVFPWDPDAVDGAPYSARSTPPPGVQTGGRFDLGTPSVLYLASRPEHAVAEILQGFRGKPLKDGHLLKPDRWDFTVFRRRALVETRLPAEIDAHILDLDDGAALHALGVRPSDLASHKRSRTQPVAQSVYGDPAGYAGLRWWSALTGEWNAAVVFIDLNRVDVDRIGYGAPDPLHVGHPAVQSAARFLGME